MLNMTSDLIEARANIVAFYEVHENHRHECEMRYWLNLLHQVGELEQKHYLAMLYRNNRKKVINALFNVK